MKHLVFIKKLLMLLLLFFLLDLLVSFVLLNGLKKASNFIPDPDILINGSSMAASGFDSEEIENLTGESVTTYIREGISVFDRHVMIDHFFSMYPEGVKTVIYEVNPVLLTGIKTAENVYTHFFPFMDDKTINDYIAENASLKEYYIHKIIRTTRFKSRDFIDIVAAYLGMSGGIKTMALDSSIIRPLISERGTEDIIVNEPSRDVFEDTMETILSHNSNIILVMMPMYYLKLQTFNEENYDNLSRYFETYSSTKEEVEFIDFNQDSIIYDTGSFFDPVHFNVYGQRYLTDAISSYLLNN